MFVVSRLRFERVWREETHVDNLALITFDSEAKAYQGLSQVKQLASAGAVELEEAAVVVRTPEGGLATKDAVGFEPNGVATGSIIGMLVGFLGGPVGVLLGWLTGGLIGATADLASSAEAASALAFLGSRIPPGSTALIAALNEPTPDALDALVRGLGGQIVRQPAAAVQEAIASAREAEAAAREAAEKAIHRGKPGDWHSKWEDVKAALKRAISA
jgi:uncharacterized membrane protein